MKWWAVTTTLKLTHTTKLSNENDNNQLLAITTKMIFKFYILSSFCSGIKTVYSVASILRFFTFSFYFVVLHNLL